MHGGWDSEDTMPPQEGLEESLVPFRADWGMGCSGRGAIACPLSDPPPIPLHSSRQAAIGLLLLDCPLHGVPRPSCLQQSLKFLQPNLSPFLPAVNAPESTAVYLLMLPPPAPAPSKQGPRSLVPRTKIGPSSWCNPTSLRPSPPWD